MIQKSTIPRVIQPLIEQRLWQGKGIIIYGARRVGKTTLARSLMSKVSVPALYLTCDDPAVRDSLTDATLNSLIRLVGDNRLIIFDEAQRVRNIGITLKLAIDMMPDRQFIATGSSSFELANKITEPLTGRVHIFQLHPLAFEEIASNQTPLAVTQLLDPSLIYGMYPEAITSQSAAESTLRHIVGGQLYKDALEYQGIKNPDQLRHLLEALALQIGNEVSYNELSGLIGINIKTVERYLALLEQSFIIFRLRPLARNKRTELRRPRKIFFYDNGVRNALIANFNPLRLRDDIGVLWENWLVSERFKYLHNHDLHPATYFWRTREGAEIDYLEEADGILKAYEFKWKEGKRVVFPRSFTRNYPAAKTNAIDPENFTTFLKPPG